jgi:AcrR family transcriptional regulator
MDPIAPPTPKGARQAQKILDAALVCLGRDGYHATSLQRVAGEAGVQKRMVSYYYGSREQLIEQAIHHLGDRLIDQIANAVKDLEEPADIIATGFEHFWTALTTDRALLVAYFGLTAEAVTDPELRPATAYITDRLRELIAKLIDDAKARGRRILLNEESLIVIIIAAVQGFVLDYLERGETPQLNDAIAQVQTALAQLAPLTEPHAAVPERAPRG